MGLETLRKDINKQKYLNMLVEMEKTSKFGGTAMTSKFSVTRNVLDALKELKCIEQIPNKGKTHFYCWIAQKPTMTLAEEVMKNVNDKMKSYVKGEKKIISKVIVQQDDKKTNFVLTDDMCIEHLKSSKEYVYKIVRYKKEIVL